MTTTTKPTTDQLTKQAWFAFLAQVTLTSIHHVYGGLMFDSVFRLSQPIIAGVELLIVLGLLWWYRQTRSGVALTLFSSVMALVGIVQRLFHTLYGHVYKDLLFLMGVQADAVRKFFFPVLPNDFIYPPVGSIVTLLSARREYHGDATSSALMKNDRFVLTKNDRHRERDLARANDWSGLWQHHPRRRRAQ